MHCLIPLQPCPPRLVPGPEDEQQQRSLQAESGRSTPPVMLRLPPPARRAIAEEERLHQALDHSAYLVPQAGSPPINPMACFASGSAAWAGVPVLHPGGDVAAEGEFNPALEEPV